MIRNISSILIITLFSTGIVRSQTFIKTTDLFQRVDNSLYTGRLNIIQNPCIDTLISRYILVNKNLSLNSGHYGMEGFRIQIYSSSNRNAREESNKAMVEFMKKFPGIISYPLYAEPGYFKIRAGDFRTKTEATKLLLSIRKEFPDAYLVPDIINFPELNIK